MKADILRTFQLARQSHLEWVVHAARLVVVIEECDAKKPQMCTQCDFGKWYEQEGCHITKFPGLKRIENFHQEFHLAYKSLYYKKFDRRTSEKNRIIFRRKFDKPIDSESTLKDKFHIVKLRYDAFDKEVQALEKIVNVMNEKLFEKDRLLSS